MSAPAPPPHEPRQPRPDLSGLRRWARFLILANIALVAIFVLLIVRQML